MARRWKTVHGHTHSRNAREAEDRGEMPITHATRAVYDALECKKHKVSLKKVRAYLEEHCYRGWHHVAGPGDVRQVAYYATELSDAQKHALLSQGSTKRSFRDGHLSGKAAARTSTP